MEHGHTALIAALVAATISFITTIITTRSTVNIARTNANKDIRLQNEKLFEEKFKAEVSFQRQKLEDLHIILSKISLENSQTVSHMDFTAKLEIPIFRERYLSNCERLHKAIAIVDIYYPEISLAIRSIYDQTNIFWGYQEQLLGTDINKEKDKWKINYESILEASSEIKDQVKKAQELISNKGQVLNDLILRTG
jgi:hypothetical protein